MPKICTVKDIEDLDEDSIVHRFVGEIIKIYPRKKGSNDKGKWTKQDIILKDDDGDRITCKVWNHDEIEDDLNGETVTVLAHKGENGWGGLYAKDDNYNGKTSRILWANKTAEIVKGGPASDGDGDNDRKERSRDRDRDDDRSERRRDRDRDKDDDKDKDRDRDRHRDRDDDRGRDRDRDDDRRKDDDGDETRKEKAINNLEALYMRAANGILKAVETSTYVRAEIKRLFKITISDEDLVKFAISLTIQAERGGCFNHLPTESLYEDAPESGADDGGKEPDEPEEKEKPKSKIGKKK